MTKYVGINKDMTVNTGMYSWESNALPEDYDKCILYPELEFLMWRYAVHTLTHIKGMYGCSELDNPCEEFVKINSEEMFRGMFKLSDMVVLDGMLDNIEIYSNNDFEELKEREALASVIFIMNNKVCVHTRNTYKYQEWDEILYGGLWVEQLTDEYFCLLTDTNDGIPVIGLYKESVAGIYSCIVNGVRRYVVMDKYTAICVYHFLYGLSTRILPTLPYRLEEFDHSDTAPDNQKSLDMCRHVFNILRDVKGIAALKEFITKESWE